MGLVTARRGIIHFTAKKQLSAPSCKWSHETLYFTQTSKEAAGLLYICQSTVTRWPTENLDVLIRSAPVQHPVLYTVKGMMLRICLWQCVLLSVLSWNKLYCRGINKVIVGL